MVPFLLSRTMKYARVSNCHSPNLYHSRSSQQTWRLTELKCAGRGDLCRFTPTKQRQAAHATGGEKATSPITAAGQAVQAAGLRHGQGKRVASEATAPLQLHTAHPKSTQEYPRGHVCHVSSDDTETRNGIWDSEDTGQQNVCLSSSSTSSGRASADTGPRMGIPQMCL